MVAIVPKRADLDTIGLEDEIRLLRQAIGRMLHAAQGADSYGMIVKSAAEVGARYDGARDWVYWDDE